MQIFRASEILGNTVDIKISLIYFVCLHLCTLSCWLVVMLDLLFYTSMYEGHLLYLCFHLWDFIHFTNHYCKDDRKICWKIWNPYDTKVAVIILTLWLLEGNFPGLILDTVLLDRQLWYVSSNTGCSLPKDFCWQCANTLLSHGISFCHCLWEQSSIPTHFHAQQSTLELVGILG